MALTLETLAPRLMAARLVSPEAVVGNAFEAHDLSRRNRVFRLRLGEGGLLVKQAGKENNHLGLQIEAAALGHIRSSPGLRRLRRWVPELVHFDASDWLLVTRLLDPATSLLKLHMNGGEADFPPEASATAGRIVAALHAAEPPASVQPPVPLKRGPIHNVNRPFHYGWGYSREEFAPATAEAFRFVDERLPAFHAQAERLSARWPQEGLMHGDIRWENFLLSPAGDELDIRLVDWEFFGVGDPAWDVACYLAEYLRFWSYTSFAATPRSPPERLYGDSGVMVPCQPPAFHASARAFVAAYREERGCTEAEWSALWERTLAYMPYALFRVIGEQCAGQQAIPVGPRLLLTHLPRWLEETPRMAQEFLGLPEAPA